MNQFYDSVSKQLSYHKHSSNWQLKPSVCSNTQFSSHYISEMFMCVCVYVSNCSTSLWQRQLWCDDLRWLAMTCDDLNNSCNDLMNSWDKTVRCRKNGRANKKIIKKIKKTQESFSVAQEKTQELSGTKWRSSASSHATRIDRMIWITHKNVSQKQIFTIDDRQFPKNESLIQVRSISSLKHSRALKSAFKWFSKKINVSRSNTVCRSPRKTAGRSKILSQTNGKTSVLNETHGSNVSNSLSCSQPVSNTVLRPMTQSTKPLFQLRLQFHMTMLMYTKLTKLNPNVHHYFTLTASTEKYRLLVQQSWRVVSLS